MTSQDTIATVKVQNLEELENRILEEPSPKIDINFSFEPSANTMGPMQDSTYIPKLIVTTKSKKLTYEGDACGKDKNFEYCRVNGTLKVLDVGLTLANKLEQSNKVRIKIDGVPFSKSKKPLINYILAYRESLEKYGAKLIEQA
jgi:hypothetical protein